MRDEKYREILGKKKEERNEWYAGWNGFYQHI